MREIIHMFKEDTPYGPKMFCGRLTYRSKMRFTKNIDEVTCISCRLNVEKEVRN